MPQGESFIIFTQNGYIYDSDKGAHPILELGYRISSGSIGENHMFHIGAENSSLICLNRQNKVVRKVPGSWYYTRAVRLPQDLHALFKTNASEVQLWNLQSFEMETDFGQCDFDDKVRELSKSPGQFFPLELEVGTGRVFMVIENFLPKYYRGRFSTSLSDIKEMLGNLVRKGFMAFATDQTGKWVWKRSTSTCLPFWMKYVLTARSGSH
jgi:hypothetical protein